ncbi:MAG TPA: hypothetical protein VND96_16745 [Candidatus Micrarchaeaceae archaeon]|nr:hypothetical protein [Candidatus Micrarchaeaceae archaeon]
MAANLRLVAAKTMLDTAGADALTAEAARALQAGMDSPSIRRLAGMTGEESDEVRTVFGSALRELGIESPTPREAAMLVAAEVALRITQGLISPYDGAKEIWNIVRKLPREHLSELDTFVYGASEWEERPEDRMSFAAGIMDAARDLVHAERQG